MYLFSLYNAGHCFLVDNAGLLLLQTPASDSGKCHIWFKTYFLIDDLDVTCNICTHQLMISQHSQMHEAESFIRSSYKAVKAYLIF